MASSGIRDRNIRSSALFAQETVCLQVAAVAQSQTAIEFMSWIAPYAGVVVSAKYYAVGATSSNAIRVEVRKNGTTLNVQSATTAIGTDAGGSQPGSAATAALLTTGPAYAGGLPSFASGDRLSLYITTGASDTLTNMACTLVVRPFLGSLERAAAGLQD